VSRATRQMWISVAVGAAIGLAVSSCAKPMSAAEASAASASSTALASTIEASSSRGASSAIVESTTSSSAPTSVAPSSVLQNTLYISCPAKISLTGRLADSPSDSKSNGTWATGFAQPTGKTAIIHQEGSDPGNVNVYSQVDVHVDAIVSGQDMPRDVEAWVRGGTTPDGSSTDAPGAGIALGADGQFFGALIPTTAESGYPGGSYLINALPLVDGSVLSVEEGCLPFPDTGQHATASVTVFENGRLQKRPDAEYPAVSLTDLKKAAS
jgi:hypothetical protein